MQWIFLSLTRFLQQVVVYQVKWISAGLVIGSLAIVTSGLAEDMRSLGNFPPDTSEEETPEPHPSSGLKLGAPVSLVLPEVRDDESVPPEPSRSCMPRFPFKNKAHDWTPLCVEINGMDRWLPKNIHKGGGLLWQNTPVGRLWRLQITSPGAYSLRVHFKKFKVGRGRVWIHNPHGQVDGPYTGKGLHRDGRFWGTYMFGDTVTIEYLPDTEAPQKQSVPFRIVQVNHLLEKMHE